MSTPLQRAEELKSLISQYQAELSDIYSEIHASKENDEKAQVVRVGSREDWIDYLLTAENLANMHQLWLEKWNAYWIYPNNSNFTNKTIWGDGINAWQDNIVDKITYYSSYSNLYLDNMQRNSLLTSANPKTKNTLNYGNSLSPKVVNFRPVFEI